MDSSEADINISLPSKFVVVAIDQMFGTIQFLDYAPKLFPLGRTQHSRVSQNKSRVFLADHLIKIIYDFVSHVLLILERSITILNDLPMEKMPICCEKSHVVISAK